MNKFDELKNKGFIVREREIAGEKCYLVFPSKIGVSWTKDNLIYRSSIWTASGEPVSLGFKKFFNLGEAAEVCPDFVEQDLKDNVAHVIEKIDGSCLIVSVFRGELIVRTRGTFDVEEHEKTRDDIAVLKKRYPKVFDPSKLEKDVSYIYEWTTRNNKIVVDYGAQTDIKLIGIVEHANYTYVPQVHLPEIALGDLHVGTAECYRIASFKDLYDRLASMTRAEGYCVYFDNGQSIKKVKCEWYLERHRLRGNCNINFMLDLFVSQGFPQHDDFIAALKTFMDFECLPEAEALAKEVTEHYQKAKNRESAIRAAIEPFKIDTTKEGRKQAARAILETYGDESGLAFTILDKGYLAATQIKKMISTQIKDVH